MRVRRDALIRRGCARSPGRTDPAGLCAFAGMHGITAPPVTVAAVEAVRRLREVCAARTGAAVPAKALDLGPLRLVIDAAGTARVVPEAAGTITAAVASAIAAGVADGTWPRLKACAADTCRWVYYDHSPAGRGRWRTMSICGSRAKMRAYRAASRRAPERGRP
ncbi:putative RNA-binding Zn ribbon-like protein [Catenuloplanes nepalensis]|uniref:RNA-binding Zn ribbon-like protein n=1 Tax=Catenuloplanes nepalensis TaxID=587533 RepID=A0ABT9MQU4_9ACTN|nr:CGNR zinc finger domain-containing protein [Catenuloplanes nepalensis]MDP9793787.1 putative RNA-binding Zn ribbon-like protein [Catenuloplanes nepalensis]